MWRDENPRVSKWVVAAVGSIVEVYLSHLEIVKQMFDVRGFLPFCPKIWQRVSRVFVQYRQLNNGAKIFSRIGRLIASESGAKLATTQALQLFWSANYTRSYHNNALGGTPDVFQIPHAVQCRDFRIRWPEDGPMGGRRYSLHPILLKRIANGIILT
jgi:hypothetical protein